MEYPGLCKGSEVSRDDAFQDYASVGGSLFNLSLGGKLMNQSEAVVLAASIAGLAALVTALLAGVVALRNESQQRSAAQKNADRQALRAQTAEVFRQMFVLQHEMEWLTWHAANRPKSLDSHMLESYESSVHESYPKMLGAMAVLASMDVGLYNQLTPLMERLFEAEGRIGRLINGLGSRRKQGSSVTQLKQLNEPIRTLYRELPPEMAEAMRYSDLLHSS
jgi:hypothetical protein